MSQPTDNTPIGLELVENGTEVELKLNDVHYKRLQELLFHGLPFKDNEHLVEVIKQVKAADYSKDPLAYHMHTILSLLVDFEEAARKAGKIKTGKFDLVNKKMVD